MNETHPIFAKNIDSLKQYYPNLFSLLHEAYDDVELHRREDGYLYAQCKRGDCWYTVSKNESISADLYSFRQEIRTAVGNGTELIFLLGIGLGYRLCAAVETLESCKEGYLVVLEESPSLFDASCHCSDLRSVFSSDFCELIVDSDLENTAWKRIEQQSWYGAKKSLFFWGYQTDQTAYQPPYSQMAERLMRWITAEQQNLLSRWRKWLETKNTQKNSGKCFLVIYHKNDQKNIYNDLSKSVLLIPDDHSMVECPIDTKRFRSQTYLMQRILEFDPDQLIWWKVPLGTWLPDEVFKSLPIPSRTLSCAMYGK